MTHTKMTFWLGSGGGLEICVIGWACVTFLGWNRGVSFEGERSYGRVGDRLMTRFCVKRSWCDYDEDRRVGLVRWVVNGKETGNEVLDGCVTKRDEMTQLGCGVL